mgnify:CR=1 FL=1
MMEKSVLLTLFRVMSSLLGCSLRVCAVGLLFLACSDGATTSFNRAHAVETAKSPINHSGPQMVADASTQAGGGISINGAVLPVPWVQIEGRTAVADYLLTDHFGATLLDTEDPYNQPVQWYLEPGQPPTDLTARVDSGYRFLDISDLAARYSWDLNVRGNTLHISQPAAQLQAIRKESFSWGERLILSVTRETLTRLAENSSGFSLTLQATTESQIVNSLPPELTGTGLTSVTLSPQPRQTILTVETAPDVRPVVSTLGNPARIIIDIRRDVLQPRNILWAPNLRWRQLYIPVAGKQFPVYWLQLQPGQGGLSLRPIWSDPVTATGITPLVILGQRWQAAAAINGGFFNRNNQYPLGAVRFDYRWISGPILSRGVVGWDNGGNALMRRLFLRQTLTTSNGESFPIQAINSGYVQAGIGLYTPAWGRNYRPILDSETVVTVVAGQVVDQRQATSVQSIPIPAEGFVLALRSFETAARGLFPGTAVTIQSDLLPSDLEAFPHIVGGGPLLINNGALVLNAEAEQFSNAFATQAAPRSAIGISPDGDLLLVAVHHSLSGPGPTLAELAQIMRQLDSTDALNLDGGSSASLYLGGRLINRNPRTAARVNNGIGVFLD